MTDSVAEKIRKLRKSKGFSQEELAEKLSISQSAYARMEKGESNSWVNHIQKLSEIFEIKPEELFSNDVNNLDQENTEQKGGMVFQFVGTINTINSHSEKLIDQYEIRIKTLEEELEYWKNLKK